MEFRCHLGGDVEALFHAFFNANTCKASATDSYVLLGRISNAPGEASRLAVLTFIETHSSSFSSQNRSACFHSHDAPIKFNQLNISRK
jgi:hypothetical protein